MAGMRKQVSIDESVRSAEPVDQPVGWRGLLCTDWRRMLFWLVVVVFSIMTLQNLYDVTSEYLENPKKADLDIVLNQTMAMPAMTFCFPSGHVLSNVVAGLQRNNGTPASLETLKQQLEKFNDTDNLVANEWTDDLVFSAFNALAAFHTYEVEGFEDEVQQRLHAFGHEKTFKFGDETDWENIKLWLDYMIESNVTVPALLQAVGTRAMMKGLTRFERETHKEQENGKTTIPANLTVEWMSFRDFCVKPTFSDEIPIESQGTFFLITFRFDPAFIVDEDVEDVVPEEECVLVDFHGSRFDREPYMAEGTQKRNGFAEPLCFGSRYEVQVEVRHEYQMIETDEGGAACKDYDDEDEDEFTCRSRCRYNHIKDLCKCVPIALTDLVENDEDEEASGVGLCNYQECEPMSRNDTYDELDCTRKCVRDCHQVHYSLKTYQRGRVVIMTPEGRPKLADNTLSVAVQFGSFEYLTVEQEYAYTFSSFIGDFGGALGMWLGLSILSVIQGITFMTSTAKRRVAGRLKGRTVRGNSLKRSAPQPEPHINTIPVN